MEKDVTPLEMVLINEHCHVLHEMHKELDQWLKRAEQLKKGSQGAIADKLSKDIEELRGKPQAFTESEDE